MQILILMILQKRKPEEFYSVLLSIQSNSSERHQYAIMCQEI